MHSDPDPLLKLLVAYALSGNFCAVEALKRYYVDGKSPSVIARELKCRKTQVRSWVLRVKDKASDRVARTAIEKLYSKLMSIKPVVVDNICTVCRIHTVKPIQHLYIKHPLLVAITVEAIVESIGSCIATQNTGL